MYSNRYLISDNEMCALRNLKNETLLYIEGYKSNAYVCDDGTIFYSCVRLHFENGDEYDIKVSAIYVDITEDFFDDVGVLSIQESSGDIWVPDGTKLFQLDHNRVIDEVLLVNDIDDLYHGDKHVNHFEFTQAIVFKSGFEYICFALDDNISETITVKRGFHLDALLPDNSGSWYEESGWSDTYDRRIETL